MKLRMVGAVAVAALACGMLAACQTNVGTAARVGGQSISESSVNDYIEPSGPATGDVNAPTAAASQLPPKVQVLQILVSERMFERTLARRGGVPSAGTLRGLHDEAARALLGAGVGTGSAVDKALVRQLSPRGIDTDLATRWIRSVELEYALIQREQVPQFAGPTATADAALTAARTQLRSTQISGATPDQLDQVSQQILTPVRPVLVRLLTNPQGADVDTIINSAFTAGLRSINVDPAQLTEQDQQLLRPLVLGVERSLQQAQYRKVPATVRAAGVRVSVSPRYGRWDAQTLTIDTKGGTPAYLRVPSTSAASPSSSPALPR